MHATANGWNAKRIRTVANCEACSQIAYKNSVLAATTLPLTF